MTYHTQTPVFGLPMIVVRPRAALPPLGGSEIEAREVYRNAGPSIRPIATAVAAYYRIEAWRLFQKRRFKTITKPRQVAMAITRNRTRLTTTDIGLRFGFDHTTVMHGIAVADRNAVAAISALLDEVRS